MLVRNIDELLQSTAELLNYPPNTVMSVIDHNFKSLHDYIDAPTHSGIRFPYLGVFRPNPKAVTYYLQNLISKLRLDRDNENLKRRFRHYWKLRLLVKEDVKRRSYKKRFGS